MGVQRFSKFIVIWSGVIFWKLLTLMGANEMAQQHLNIHCSVALSIFSSADDVSSAELMVLLIVRRPS